MAGEFRVEGFVFTLESLAESDEHLAYLIEQHTPDEGRGFCPVCDLRSPCDVVSLAASGLARSADLDAARAEGAALRAAGGRARRAAFDLTGAWLAPPGITLDEMKPLIVRLIEALDHEGDVRAGDV